MKQSVCVHLTVKKLLVFKVNVRKNNNKSSFSHFKEAMRQPIAVTFVQYQTLGIYYIDSCLSQKCVARIGRHGSRSSGSGADEPRKVLGRGRVAAAPEPPLDRGVAARLGAGHLEPADGGQAAASGLQALAHHRVPPQLCDEPASNVQEDHLRGKYC